jgi:2-phosphosulfolactate phosphatase
MRRGCSGLGRSMEIRRLKLLEGAQEARGIAVVVDVFRAFSCEPVLHALGAERVLLEADVDKCLTMRGRAVLLGELDGSPIDGFDLPNSPYFILRKGAQFFRGRPAVHRSSAGVRGALAAMQHADEVMLTSFMTARATADYILARRPGCVSIVAMGDHRRVEVPEDFRCADYVDSLLSGRPYDHLQATDEILSNDSAQKFLRGDQPQYPREDPALCLQRDLFDFGLRAEKRGDWIEAVKVTAA